MGPGVVVDLSEAQAHDVHSHDVHSHEARRLAAADEIRELAAHVHAAEARLATMVAAFTADGMWNASGDWRSVAQWLGVNCGYGAAEARALERVAAAVDVMPRVMERVSAGEVSLGVASMAARVVVPELDDQLASIVANTTPTQAARVLAEYRAAERRRILEAADAPGMGEDSDSDSDTAGDDASDDGVVDAASWRSWFDEAGDWHGEGRAPAEVGALLDEAFVAATRAAERSAGDDVSGAGGGGRPGVVDALRELADMVLDVGRQRRLTREGGEHFGVTVLIDIETLVSGTLRPGSVCRLESGPHVTPGLVRRLAEEGFLQALWHRGGVPLMLGTEARLASREQRRALRFRDGGCSVPGCGAQRHLHAHHIVRYPAGPTDLDNLVLLCSFHHRRLHQGRLSIEADGQQRFVFRNHLGEEIGNRLIRHVRRPGRAPTGKLELLPEQTAIPIDGDTPRPAGGYAPLTEYARDIYLHALLTAPEFSTAAA